MKKQGFTLVELLAVIAILAILVILVVPRVIQLFEGSQDGLFRRDAQSIFKAVTNDVLASSVAQRGKKLNLLYSSAANVAKYKTCGEHTVDTFELDGIKDLAYFIKVDRNRVKEFVVCSNAYCVKMSTTDGANATENPFYGQEELDLGSISDVAITTNTLDPVAAVNAIKGLTDLDCE